MQASDRGNVDDVARLLLLHNLDLLLHAPEDAEDINAPHLFELFGRCVADLLGIGGDARIVDCSVKTTVDGDCLLMESFD